MGNTLKEADEEYKREAHLREMITKYEIDIKFLEQSSESQAFKAISQSLEQEKKKLDDLKSGVYDKKREDALTKNIETLKK